MNALTTILEIKNIETYYDLIYAVRGASLSVEEGTITAILGNNGAGIDRNGKNIFRQSRE